MTPLVDAFGRVHTYLRISVTDRCNLRCVYCMPADGIHWQPKNQLLTFDELARLVRLFARWGVNKVRITGGEPLVRQDLHVLVAQIARVPSIRKIALTTNGSLLKQQLPALKAAGVTHLNISLDTLRQDRFAAITLRAGLEDVLEAIELAIAAGYRPLKLNVVVMGGVNDDELLDFVRFCQGRPINLRFIEFMPFRDNDWSNGKVVPYQRMRRTIAEHFTLRADDASGDPSNVAREFILEEGGNTVGFITSMTEDFCSTCNRVRLTADGYFKSCLHHPAEVSLRDPMRQGVSDEQLEQLVREALMLKPEKHAPGPELVQIGNRSMIEIGG